ncbi:MAG: chemotaxis protein CheW [Planctomycetia bacterium]
MQILTFTVAGQPYAIPSRTVLEVLPLVPVRPIPLLPSYVPGVFTYRGRLVPLVDLARRFETPVPEPAGRRRLSTRVIVVEFVPPEPPVDEQPALPPARPVRLGLVADNVVSVQTASAGDMVPTAPGGQAPFLGKLLRLGGSTVQMVVVDHLLPHDLLIGLVAAAGATGP